jgi:glycosyltransferase involved in cell wall biosynthesis
MKILAVNMTLDRMAGGGTAARTIEVCRALTDLGVRCTIATNDGREEWGTTEPLPGIDLLVLPRVGGRFRVPVSGLRALGAAVRDVDLVLLMNHWTVINALAYRRVRASGVPYVVCPLGALPLHGRSRGAKRIYNATVGCRIIAHADAHVAVTTRETQDFAAYGVDPARVSVIPNGVPLPASVGDAAVFRARHRLGSAPLLLFLGRLADIKGPDLLIDAFARSGRARDGWHLVLAGPDDGMQAELERAISRLGLDACVHLVGFLDERQKQDALAASDLVVIPSRREAMSIVVLEAAAAARPVLLTDQCGVPEVGSQGGGWIVDATADAIAAGLRDATSDRSRLTSMGQVWKRFALDHFSWRRTAQLHVDVFDRVLAGARDVRAASIRPAS